MNKSNISLITLAISLLVGGNVLAASLSKADYKIGRDKIAFDYKSAKIGCDALSGNANDICVADAKGKKSVSLAELEFNYKPTVKHESEIRVAKAEANYDVAIQRCDDMAGNTKDICVKEAKAAKVSGKADAKAHLKNQQAASTANETISDANAKANAQMTSAQKEAATDKNDAQYKVAKEKCDAFSGAVKDNCLTQIKPSYGK
jgi:uncharacterized protein with WD repeat